MTPDEPSGRSLPISLLGRSDVYSEAFQRPKVEVRQPCGRSSQWFEMPVGLYWGIPLLPTALHSFVRSKRAGHARLRHFVKCFSCTHKLRLCLCSTHTHARTHSAVYLLTCMFLLCWIKLLIFILVSGTFLRICALNVTLLVNQFSKCF